MDLVSLLAHLCKDNQFSCEIEHMYIHQDDATSAIKVKQILNCRMDKFTKQIARVYIVRPWHIRYDPATLGVGSIICRGTKIIVRVDSALGIAGEHCPHMVMKSYPFCPLYLFLPFKYSEISMSQILNAVLLASSAGSVDCTKATLFIFLSMV